MHDLLRAYACGLAAANADTDSVEAALERLLDYYLAAASAAMDSLFPAERHRRPLPPQVTTALPELGTPQSALSWLDKERATLVALAQCAAIHGRESHAVRLSTTLFRYLASGRYSDGLVIHEHARCAARAVGDRLGEAQALLGLIDAYAQLGSRQIAAELAERALSLFRQTADRSGEARARYSLGMIDWLSGRYDNALDHAEPALALAREVGDEIGEAKAHTLFGLVALNQSRLTHAQASFQASAALYQRRGDHSGQAYTLHNLGCVGQAQRRHRQAAELQRHALSLFEQLGDRAGQAMTLDGLAAVHAARNQTDQAVHALELALSIVQDIGDRRTEPVALNSLGEVVQGAGKYLEAVAHHTAAATVALAVDAPFEEARAHAGLGDAYLALNRPEPARSHYKQALVLYEQLGVPQADQVRSRLDAVGY
jgi:tetratricopeptide (TPR) repeat protein